MMIEKTEQTMEIQEEELDQMDQEQSEAKSPEESPETEQQEPVSATGKERAAVVLEVLAGMIQPAEAAEKLGIHPPAYYNLESRALQGLVRACEVKPKGPGVNLKKQIRDLEEENQKLVREARRYQSLTRAAQKAIGLMETREEKPKQEKKKSTAKKNGKKKRTPKKTRALRAAERLRGIPARKKKEKPKLEAVNTAETKQN